MVLRRSTGLVVIFLIACLAPRHAAGSDRRVVVLNGDAPLLDALVHALAPWGLVVVGMAAQPPDSDVPAAAKGARSIASSTGAGAVVWIARGPEDDSLCVYDASTQQIVVRSLPTRLPFDEPTSAAVALSVKTVLRSTPIAPAPERLGPSEPPTPAPIALDRRTSEPPARQAPHKLYVEVGVGGRSVGGAGIDPRASVGAGWWPTARFGAGVAVSGGSGVTVDGPTVSGRFIDVAVAAAARVRLQANDRVSVQLAAGFGGHVTNFAANVASTGAHPQAYRVNPSVDGSALVDVSVSPRVQLGLLVGLSYELYYPRYSAAGQVVFSPPPVDPSAALRLSVPFD